MPELAAWEHRYRCRGVSPYCIWALDCDDLEYAREACARWRHASRGRLTILGAEIVDRLTGEREHVWGDPVPERHDGPVLRAAPHQPWVDRQRCPGCGMTMHPGYFYVDALCLQCAEGDDAPGVPVTQRHTRETTRTDR